MISVFAAENFVVRYLHGASSISNSDSSDPYPFYASLKYRQIMKMKINDLNINNWRHIYHVRSTLLLWKKVTIKYYCESENQTIIDKTKNEDHSNDFQYFGLPGVWFCLDLEENQHFIGDTLNQIGFPFSKAEKYHSIFCLSWKDYEKLQILMEQFRDETHSYSKDDRVHKTDLSPDVAARKASRSWIQNSTAFKLKSLSDSNKQKAYENFFNSFHKGEIVFTCVFWSDRLVLNSKIVSEQKMSLNHPEIYFNMANLYHKSLNSDGNTVELLRNLAWQQQENGTLVVTFIDSSYHTLLINWLIHLRKTAIKLESPSDDPSIKRSGERKLSSDNGASGFLIVCLDNAIYQWLRKVHAPCFLTVSSSAKERARKNKKKTRHQLGSTWLQRTYYLNILLSFGLDIVLSDVDAIWKANPKFLHYVSNDDLIMSRGSFPVNIAQIWGFTGCMGWVLYKPHVMNLLLSTKMMWFMKNQRPDDQVAVNILLNQLVEPFKTVSQSSRPKYSGNYLKTQWNPPALELNQENDTEWATSKVNSILPWYSQYHYKTNKTTSTQNISDNGMKKLSDIESNNEKLLAEAWFFQSINNTNLSSILIDYSVAILPYSFIQRYCANKSNENLNSKSSLPYIQHCHVEKDTSLRENILKALGLWRLSDNWRIETDLLYKNKNNSSNRVSYDKLLQLLET